MMKEEKEMDTTVDVATTIPIQPSILNRNIYPYCVQAAQTSVLAVALHYSFELGSHNNDFQSNLHLNHIMDV